MPTIPQTEKQAASTGQIPMCPKCGIPMVERTAKRGNHTGEQFYGCVNYPRCGVTRPMA